MDILERVDFVRWVGDVDDATQERTVAALEQGRVLFFSSLTFTLTEAEKPLLSPACADAKAKNISFDPATGMVRGSACVGSQRDVLGAMMARYAAQTKDLLHRLLPKYRNGLRQARTSYRPVAVEGRASSPKKDDRRLHVDAFPSRPSQGHRILRVFTNVNPSGLPRLWQIGEPFEDFTAKFLPRVSAPCPGSAWLLELAGITKGRRTLYDHAMLRLHDLAKEDRDYQRTAPRTEVAFPPGSTWVVFTDRVLHAALGGQYLFEQTFHLPVTAMQEPDRSPLRILERAWQRLLA